MFSLKYKEQFFYGHNTSTRVFVTRLVMREYRFDELCVLTNYCFMSTVLRGSNNSPSTQLFIKFFFSVDNTATCLDHKVVNFRPLK